MLVHKELPVFDKLAVMDLEGTIHHNRLVNCFMIIDHLGKKPIGITCDGDVFAFESQELAQGVANGWYGPDDLDERDNQHDQGLLDRVIYSHQLPIGGQNIVITMRPVVPELRVGFAKNKLAQVVKDLEVMTNL